MGKGLRAARARPGEGVRPSRRRSWKRTAGKATRSAAAAAAASLCAFLCPPAVAAGSAPASIARQRVGDPERELLFLTGANRSASVEHRLEFKGGDAVTLACPEWRRWNVVVADGGQASIGRLSTCFAKSSKLAIWYHGGPFGAVNDTLPPEQVAMLAAGYDLFEPFYPLSADRDLLYDEVSLAPALTDAEREGRAAIGWGRRRYARLAIVGESLGAIFAATASRHAGRNDLIVYLNPYFGSADELIEGFRGSEADIKAKAGLTFPAFADIIRKFMRGWRPLTDEAVAALPRDPRVGIVYSPADARVNGAALDRAARAAPRPCRIDRRPGNGHEPAATREQYNRFLQLLSC